MNTQNRMLVAVALCAVILVVFDFLNPKPPPGEAELAAPSAAAEAGIEGEAGEGKDAAGEKGIDSSQSAEDSPGSEAPTAKVELVEHEVRNELIAWRLSNRSPGRGGILVGSELLSDQFAGHDTATKAFHMGDAASLEVSFADEATDFRIPRGARFEVQERTERSMKLAYRNADVEVVETFELLDGYEAKLLVAVTNRSKAEQTHRMHVGTQMGTEGGGQYDVRRGLCRTSDGLEEEDDGDVEDAPAKFTGAIRWGGVDAKYFTSLVVPSEPVVGCEISASEDQQFIRNRLSTGLGTLDPGETKVYEFGLYMGAKELERLGAFSAVALPERELEEAIDWGMLGAVSETLGRMLLAMLRWFHDLTGVWGVSIVLLTVVVKAVTLPLTLKQMSSMKAMKTIQPEIKKIKEKYADDRVKQGQEMQALFARSGANPLAGCLPMVVQLPIWFALYSMLGTAVELVHESFLWLPDLTKQDPFYLLPLGLGAMMILQNRMMPTGGDEAQAKMMRWIMPVMFTAFMLFLPSGLGVYIFVNIVLSVIQTAIQVGTGKSEAEAKAG